MPYLVGPGVTVWEPLIYHDVQGSIHGFSRQSFYTTENQSRYSLQYFYFKSRKLANPTTRLNLPLFPVYFRGIGYCAASFGSILVLVIEQNMVIFQHHFKVRKQSYRS